jgi:hypothetical protein
VLIAAALIVSSLGVPTLARAIDPSLCDDDGVTEIPPFAQGRDGRGCLLIDPGNGDPAVPFQFEVFHKRGIAINAKDGDPAPPGGWVDIRADALGGPCPSRDAGHYCSFIFWNLDLDNYLHPSGKNEDIFQTGPGTSWEYVYFKNSTLANGWKCSGGSKAWGGPNGIGCAAGEDSGAHSDGIQAIASFVNDGWFVLQDSALVNAHTQLMLLQDRDTSYPKGTNFLFQGVQLGTTQSFKEARTWIDDCYARGSDTPCENNRATIGHPAKQMWIVDVWGNVPFSRLSGIKDKLVIVNTGCGSRGCGGSIEYANGWPWSYLRESVKGPGVCPNGLIDTNPAGSGDVAAVFCYTSLENALADRVTSTSNVGDCPPPHCPHKAPPFIRLSVAGWQTPPGTATQPPPRDTTPPRPPILLPQ